MKNKIIRVVATIIMFPIAVLFWLVNTKQSIMPKIRKWYIPPEKDYMWFFSWNKGKINIKVTHVLVWIVFWVFLIYQNI